jgi:hypothetical protein
LAELFILEPITRRIFFLNSRGIFIAIFIFILGTFQLINTGFLRKGDLKRARPNPVLRFDGDVFLAFVMAQEMALKLVKYFNKILLETVLWIRSQIQIRIP